MKKQVILSLITLLMSGMSFGDDSTPPQIITGIQTGWGGEGVYFYFNGGAIVEGCSSNTVMVEEGVMLDRILSIALSAYHSGKKVQFRISGCNGSQMKGVAIASVDS